MVKADVNLGAAFRVTRTYDLRGTMGIAFYWWGAANPPSALVQFIVETPTGFWFSEFYDGPAQYRHVFIPWGSFTWVSSPQRLLEPHRHGFNEPDKSQIDGFIWTVHTSGIRRIDYIYAPVGDVLPAKFTVRRSTSANLSAAFNVRHSTSANLVGKINVVQVEDLPAEFIARQPGSQKLLAEFISRHPGSQELPSKFEVGP